MQNSSERAEPTHALWIGTSRDTIKRTSAIANSFFIIHSPVAATELNNEELAKLLPGSPIILEFDAGDDSADWVENSNRILRRVLDAVETPIVLCVGSRVSAEVVVDWVRAGAFSYVERTADEQHFHEAFRMIAHQSAEVKEQHFRYERLLQLWNSITEREGKVLNMLMEGLPNKKIANRLGVSQRTIEARRQKLYEKLESRSVVEVVRTIYELDSLEHVFRRVDSGHRSSSQWPPNASEFLQTLPSLRSNLSGAHFRNVDEIQPQSLSHEAE